MMTYLYIVYFTVQITSRIPSLCPKWTGMRRPAPHPTVMERPFFRSKHNFAGVQDDFPLRRTLPSSSFGFGCWNRAWVLPARTATLGSSRWLARLAAGCCEPPVLCTYLPRGNHHRLLAILRAASVLFSSGVLEAEERGPEVGGLKRPSINILVDLEINLSGSPKALTPCERPASFAHRWMDWGRITPQPHHCGERPLGQAPRNALSNTRR